MKVIHEFYELDSYIVSKQAMEFYNIIAARTPENVARRISHFATGVVIDSRRNCNHPFAYPPTEYEGNSLYG
jgi:hypothetical protein